MEFIDRLPMEYDIETRWHGNQVVRHWKVWVATEWSKVKEIQKHEENLTLYYIRGLEVRRAEGEHVAVSGYSESQVMTVF